MNKIEIRKVDGPFREIKWKTYMRAGFPIRDEKFNLIDIPTLEINRKILAGGLVGDIWEANVVEEGFAKDSSNKMGFCLEYLTDDLLPDEKPHWICTGLINLAGLRTLALYSNA